MRCAPCSAAQGADGAGPLERLRQRGQQQVDVAMSNGFGFGGTNGTLVFRRT